MPSPFPSAKVSMSIVYAIAVLCQGCSMCLTLDAGKGKLLCLGFGRAGLGGTGFRSAGFNEKSSFSACAHDVPCKSRRAVDGTREAAAGGVIELDDAAFA